MGIELMDSSFFLIFGLFGASFGVFVFWVFFF